MVFNIFHSLALIAQVRLSTLDGSRNCTSRKLSSHAGRAHKLSLLPDNPAVSIDGHTVLLYHAQNAAECCLFIGLWARTHLCSPPGKLKFCYPGILNGIISLTVPQLSLSPPVQDCYYSIVTYLLMLAEEVPFQVAFSFVSTRLLSSVMRNGAFFFSRSLLL